jgi:hypothetical protein
MQPVLERRSVPADSEKKMEERWQRRNNIAA